MDHTMQWRTAGGLVVVADSIGAVNGMRPGARPADRSAAPATSDMHCDSDVPSPRDNLTKGFSDGLCLIFVKTLRKIIIK